MTTRREVLRAAGGAITIVCGGLRVALGQEAAAVVASSGLGDRELLVLTAMMRRILPHDGLDPGVYRDAVLAFANGAVTDAEVAAGLAQLAASSFLDAPADEQVAALRAIENAPFFAAVRGAAVRGVYGDARTWELLGYGGDASRFGGYIERGFDDIDWLPGTTADRDP